MNEASNLEIRGSDAPVRRVKKAETAALQMSLASALQSHLSALSGSVVKARFPSGAPDPESLTTDPVEVRYTAYNANAGFTASTQSLRLSEKDGQLLGVIHSASSPFVDALPAFGRGGGRHPVWVTDDPLDADLLASLDLPTLCLAGVPGWSGPFTDGGRGPLLRSAKHLFAKRRLVLAFRSLNAGNLYRQQGLIRVISDGTAAADEVSIFDPFHHFGGTIREQVQKLSGSEATKYLQDHVVSFGGGRLTPLCRMGVHPDSGEALYAPHPYLATPEGLAIPKRPEGMERVLLGVLSVRRIGRHSRTGVQYAYVSYSGGSHEVEVALDYSEMSLGDAPKQLAQQGVPVNTNNKRHVQAFLSEFTALNESAIPKSIISDRLGIAGNSFIGPSWSVGEAIEYVGDRRITISTDPSPYEALLRALARWNDAWVPLFLLGIAAASPVLNRLKVPRAPVVDLFGSSNRGKTTVARTALGVFGDATQAPLAVQAGRSSWAGLAQTRSEIPGYPFFLDEAHTADKSILEGLLYQAANGQSYARGSKTGRFEGSEQMLGAVLLCGEEPLSLVHQGSVNRALVIDCEEHPPLGLAYAPDRADLFSAAWQDGAGAWGERLTSTLWTGTSDLKTRAAEISATLDDTLGGREWWVLLATAQAAMEVWYRLAAIERPAILSHVAATALSVLADGRSRFDPVSNAFEALRGLWATAEQDVTYDDHRRVNGELFARVDDSFAYVRVGSASFKQVVSTNPSIARKWVDRQLAVPSGASATHSTRFGEAKQRCIKIPMQLLTDGVAS